MKGVIWGICPDAQVVDLTHQIPSFDVDSASFAVVQALPYFPDNTLHLIVVDPGVGTARRALAVQGTRGRYVAPDNGVLGPILAEDPPKAAHEIVPSDRVPRALSDTFHGRDVFAPAAAHLAAGIPLEQLGSPIDDDLVNGFAPPEKRQDGWLAQVIHVDRFGNLITNITPENLAEINTIKINGLTLPVVRRYGDIGTGHVGALVGSADRLEIFVREGSAKEALKAGRGSQVIGLNLPIGDPI